MPDIDKKFLVALVPEQESEQRFPPGCPVWYSLEYSTSSSSSSTSNRHLSTLEACGGVVRAIFIDLKSREIVYKVESNRPSLPDNEAGEQIFLLEGQLAFASNCRVKARGMLDEDEMNDVGLEGVILCPFFPPPSNDRNANGMKKLSYAIRFLLDGRENRHLMVKFDVDPDLVAYNPSPSFGGGGGGETASALSRRGEENRDPGAEIESDKVNDSVFKASLDNNIEETLAAQAQQRSLAMECAVIHPDSIDHGCISSIRSDNFPQERSVTCVLQQCNGAPEISFAVQQHESTAATEESNHQHHSVNDTTYEKPSDSISLNRDENISQPSSLPTKTAVHASYEQRTMSVEDPSLSVSHPAKPCSTVDNALAPDSDQEGIFPQRWGPPERRATPSLEITQKQSSSNTVNEDQNNEGTCVLTVPLWALKKCVRRNDLFLHLVGVENGIRGHKVLEIIRKTKTSIHFSRYCRDKSVPMIITIEGNRNNVTQAKRWIVESLLKFLADPSLERRLVYEMGMTAEGTLHIQKADGAVKVACHITHNLIWMKLLKYSSRGMKLLLNDGLRRELIKDTNCHIEVYGLQDDPPTMSVPYVFICGNVLDEVNKVTSNVACLIKQHQQRDDSLNRALGGGGGGRGASFDGVSYNRDVCERGLQWLGPPMKRIDEKASASLILGLGMTTTKRPRVPDGGGEETNRLSGQAERLLEETNCSVKICRNNIKDGALQVKIDADENRCLVKARKNIMKLLVEFLNDECSNGRLLYELMVNLEGCNNGTTENGFVRHEQEYYGRKNVMVWMKLLELPYFKSKGKNHAHGNFLLQPYVLAELTHGTGCSIDVYGFGNKTPLLCDPYVIISAGRKEEVNIVAERVTDKLLTHQEKCILGCKFLTRTASR
ncbi:hypothetical protein ACHAW5_005174 [Stephanodiscus triporus]|uniref:Uncharacterized protein n=1 Tax=Stephanodiscus triporus TaxID=2934178 RepID=A0ABD3MK81_9STRA